MLRLLEAACILDVASDVLLIFRVGREETTARGCIRGAY